jgi:hypothetical protein
MTVPPEPALSGENGSAPTQPPRDLHTASIFDPMTSREVDLLLAVMSAGWRMVSAVHPLLCPLYHEVREVIEDLNAAWWVAFERENPGRLRVSANGCAR